MDNKQIKEMMPDEIMNLPKLGLDDTFDFTCKACGKCCKHREDILLTPYDLFRIAADLHRTPKEIIERYCEVYEGGTSHFPVVRAVPVPPDNSCPFMRNRKCSIHAKKPVVCRVYPLARMFTEEGESRYLFNGAGCKHDPKTVTVREWIGDISTEESETAGRLWRDVIFTIGPAIQPDKLKVSADIRQQILAAVFAVLWLNYDIEAPFVPQLEKKIEALKNILEAMKNET
jgi:Fe-S-cluster containining protein